ncbi:MAG: hypothetical protein CVV24_04885 [Ignavibacteriae bacterium HGW-Ignavibacteriae-3]|nr:MAG: hypothetical protein CVV24_04885 [Ignavibacteriae bacterium HGW-Ignavibacteriae-3]
MKILTPIFDFFLPRLCPSCKNKLTPLESVACVSCLSKIEQADPERIANEYIRKFLNDKIIAGFASLFIFEKDKEIQHLIHGLKYEGKFQIGLFLGELTAIGLREEIEKWKIDFIVPVPLHHLKRAERGFNQSDYIAGGMKKILNIPVKSNYIKRCRFTETQTNLTLLERAANIEGAFRVKKRKIIKGKRILIVDDVITTGATVSECGKALTKNGAAKVYAVSVAIAE